MNSRFYRSLYEHALDGVLIVTQEGAVLKANPRARDLLARTEEEILREGRAGIMVADESFEKWRREGMKEETWRGEINFRRKDGTTFPAEVSSGASITDDGLPMTILSFRDISLLKFIENELGQARENLERGVRERTFELKRQAELLNLAYDAIVVRDMDGRITFWSRGAEEVYGWTAEEALGHVSYELLNTRADLPVTEIERQVIERGHWEGELREKRKDGPDIIVSSRWSVQRDPEARPVAFLETNSDVTEQVRLGRQLREAQKLEAIGTLSSGIAHDFNNILAAVIGFAELGVDRTPSDSPVHRYLSQILRAGVRGSQLVRQILTFARSGEQQKRPLSLGPIVKESLRLLRASVPATIDIRADLKSESDVVMADPAQVQQIVMNLATNSVHAMREKGGTLEVGLTSVIVPSPGSPVLLKPGGYVALTVRDTGTGIPEGIREHIFEPFFTTKERGEGTGLGLAMVHGIVKGHGGEITVSSEPGKGCLFTVYFPAVNTDEVFEAREYRQAPLPRGHESLLLIDDEPLVVDMETEILEDLGYRVTPFINPAGAVGVFRDNPHSFDLVITDQTMPGMTGIELAREIHGIRKDIPVILVSGYSDLADSRALKTAPIAASLQKPVIKADIAETVRSVLDSAAPRNIAPDRSGNSG